jgi:hypothetical protein
VIRGAFVLRLESGTQPSQQLSGWIEEVDTGREFHLISVEEMLMLVSQGFSIARHRNRP